MRAIISCVLNVNRKLVGYCLPNRMNKASKPGLAAATLKSVLSAVLNHTEIGAGADGLVDVLPTPTKSIRDKKEYKVIRLPNGLTACLISDMANLADPSAPLQSASDLDSETDSEESSDSDTEVTSSESESQTESEEDDASDDSKPLSRGEKEVKLAAAALCIGVGSFSDPNEIQGLAHFLEHMVFMGSEKYPEENDFDSFIKKHGGSDNASTDYECTTFYFECFEKHLLQALDKFSQFFIAPLLKRDSLQREREAIESEFQIALPDDEYRREQLLLSLANEGSPANKFSWGNLITLRDQVTDDELYAKLHAFRKRHYSSHRMKLAIQARLPLSVLESYVVECFSAVPNNGLSPDDFSLSSNGLFDTPQFRKIYYIKPMKDLCQVDLTWTLPPLLHLYKSKPQVYVSWLLGHEGKGSLLSYLKKKLWALSLCCGNGDSDGEYNSLYAYLNISIPLTREGLNHIDEVIEAVFGYIKMLNTVGPSERIFRELQLIEDTAFRFEEDESASDKVEDLAECMLYYPPEHYMTGQELFFEYDSKAIEMVMQHLVPDKMNIMVSNIDIPGVTFDQVEPWFQTQYAKQDIPESWMQRWLNVATLPEFHLPEPNEFLTNDFSLLPPDPDIPEFPQKVLETPSVDLWYRKDQKFELPVAYYNYYFITPLSKESVQSSVMLDMFTITLALQLAEEIYPAALAELGYSILPAERGFLLKLNGYNEKLPVLLNIITKYFKQVADTLSEGLFEAVKDCQKKAYYNGFLKPKRLNKEMRLSILQDIYFSHHDKYHAIDDITLDKLRSFLSRLGESFYVHGLIQGNITSSTAVQITNEMIEDMKFRALPQNALPIIKVAEIPNGERCCKLMSANEDNTNSIITNYYQCGPIALKDNMILELIMLLIEEPLFDILRTKEQLGYDVYPTIRDTFGMLGYSITVNTQADKHAVEHVDARIEAFLKHARKLIKKLSDKKFVQTKADLIKMKQVVDFDLDDEVQRNWAEICSRRYQFDRVRQEIPAIEQLKIGEVKQWWDNHTLGGNKNTFRKLSVQVVGHVKPSANIKTEQEHVDEAKHIIDNIVEQANADASQSTTGEQKDKVTFNLKLLGTELETNTLNKSKDYFIRDVEQFKKTLIFIDGR